MTSTRKKGKKIIWSLWTFLNFVCHRMNYAGWNLTCPCLMSLFVSIAFTGVLWILVLDLLQVIFFWHYHISYSVLSVFSLLTFLLTDWWDFQHMESNLFLGCRMLINQGRIVVCQETVHLKLEAEPVIMLAVMFPSIILTWNLIPIQWVCKILILKSDTLVTQVIMKTVVPVECINVKFPKFFRKIEPMEVGKETNASGGGGEMTLNIPVEAASLTIVPLP